MEKSLKSAIELIDFIRETMWLKTQVKFWKILVLKSWICTKNGISKKVRNITPPATHLPFCLHPFINKGPVIKMQANQKYTTDGDSGLFSRKHAKWPEFLVRGLSTEATWLADQHWETFLRLSWIFAQ